MPSLFLCVPRTGCHASIVLPGDKSISHRALMLAAIAWGRTRIVGCNAGEDVRATARALQLLGVSVHKTADGYDVVGTLCLRDPRTTIDCGNSGTTMRLLAGVLAGRVDAVLDGDASLRRRPMSRVTRPLSAMGARITTRAGRPPLTTHRRAARLRGIHYRMPVASAQVKSALLLAALRAEGPSTIVEPVPTRDHTELMLKAMGARLHLRGRTLRIAPSSLRALGRVRVPGDLSSAVYLLCAAATLPGAVLTVRRVGINPSRVQALQVMKAMGVALRIRRRTRWNGEQVADLTVSGGRPLRNLSIGTRMIPGLIDEIPALCALATTARGVFTVRGAGELRVKESDRIATTVELLRSFAGDARALADGIVVRGDVPLRAPRSISTQGDHRVGLAAAILAAATRSTLKIRDSTCIATSLPGFAALWRRAF
jgi:3-phosphoshikimate 1-carboxyvinyltransferase